jgi:hypothetical protein
MDKHFDVIKGELINFSDKEEEEGKIEINELIVNSIN